MVFVVSTLGAIASAQQSPEHLFQAGLYAEEIKGDLHEALKFYQKIVQDFPDNRRVAAKAQLQIGICYEKLGQQKAFVAYQKVLENYPDQREVAAVAREHLSRLKTSAIRNPKSEISPLVKYYYERVGFDLMTATSLDGKSFAYTDWTTGSLMIKDLQNPPSTLKTSEIRNPKSAIEPIRIVEADFSRSPEYAYRPAWSRDGKFIAYSWYRQPFFVELRVVSMSDGKSRAVCSEPGLIFNPQDWSPDGKSIVCEVLNYKLEPDRFKRLFLISLDSKQAQDLIPVKACRDMRFSPDGKYITYDGEFRHIYVLALADLQQTRVYSSSHGYIAADAPVWSADGKLLLFRSFRLGQYNLWALPMMNGKPSDQPYLLQSDLTRTFLALKGANHSTQAEMPRSMNRKHMPRSLNKTAHAFVEEFSSPLLDSAWSLFEWKGPNVYDYASFDRYSLTDHPGHLRYYLGSMTGPSHQQSYLPSFSGWYWHYPSLEISRPLDGDHWVLEAKATYSMVSGANARGFGLIIFFDPARDRETVLCIFRTKDMSPQETVLGVQLLDHGIVIAQNQNCLSPGDTFGVTPFTYTYRISRADTLIRVELRDDDGRNYRQVLSGSLRPDLRGLPQLLALMGNSWFVPAGAYVDWDYIRFRNADF